MKALCIILWLMIEISTLTNAQEADSIVVSFDNQHTTIPLPAFGKQTTIKMADSVQMIEIAVSRRKLSDIQQAAFYPSNPVTPGNPSNKVKWYSQIEVGYIMNFMSNNSKGLNIETTDYINLEPVVFCYNTDNLKGYKIGLSIFERERHINNKLSFINGFKLGFAQSYRKYKEIPSANDTVVHIYVGYEALNLTRIQFLFPFELSYLIASGKSNTKLIFGSNIGSSIGFNTMRHSNIKSFTGSPLILQPFLGIEKGKLGLLASADLSFGSTYDYSMPRVGWNLGYGLGIYLTYRLF